MGSLCSMSVEGKTVNLYVFSPIFIRFHLLWFCESWSWERGRFKLGQGFSHCLFFPFSPLPPQAVVDYSASAIASVFRRVSVRRKLQHIIFSQMRSDFAHELDRIASGYIDPEEVTNQDGTPNPNLSQLLLCWWSLLFFRWCWTMYMQVWTSKVR